MSQELRAARKAPSLDWRRRVHLFIRGLWMIGLGVLGIWAYLRVR